MSQLKVLQETIALSLRETNARYAGDLFFFLINTGGFSEGVSENEKISCFYEALETMRGEGCINIEGDVGCNQAIISLIKKK